MKYFRKECLKKAQLSSQITWGEKLKELTEKDIQNMRQQPCQFPGCKEKMNVMVSLPVFKPDKDKILHSTGDQRGVPVCFYHTIITQSGFFNLVDEQGEIKWNGPIPIVDIVELVWKAKEIQFKQKIQEKTNESKSKSEQQENSKKPDN